MDNSILLFLIRLTQFLYKLLKLQMEVGLDISFLMMLIIPDKVSLFISQLKLNKGRK